MHEPPTDLNAFLTRGQVAALLYVDPKTVSRWALTGKIYSTRTPGGQWRFLRSDILALAAVDRGHPHPVSPPAPAADQFGHEGTDLRLGRAATAPTTDHQAALAVVAQAVDVARQAQVVESAQAVITRRLDVEAAARVVAGAARRARASRATAAASAARSVAVSAGRAAAAVQREADAAASVVRDTAARTAGVASPGSSGTIRQETAIAAALVVAARAAAVVTARGTAAAAADVATAVAAAAVVVAREVSERDAEIEARVAEVAEAVRAAAAATARQAAAKVGTRATGVADVARRVTGAGPVDDEEPASVVRSPMELCRELLDATRRLDGHGVGAALDRSLADLGLHRTVQDVLLPSMREVGARWSRGQCDVDQEQLATASVRSWLEQRALEAPPPVKEAPIVLACGPSDRHTLGLQAFAVLLRHEGFDCHELGPQISPSALSAAVTSCSAQAVVLVSHLTTSRAPAVSALRAVDDSSVTLFYAGAAFRTRATRLGVPGQYLGGNFTDAAAQVRTQLHGTS